MVVQVAQREPAGGEAAVVELGSVVDDADAAAGATACEIDATMVEVLRENALLPSLSARITNLASAVNAELFRDYLERSALIREAWDNHIAGRYASAVALVLTQVEGIVADVTDNKMFFSSNASRAAEMVDSTTIAGLVEGLSAVRKVYTEAVDRTSVDGLLSRHGILHGRELRFGTEVHSFEAFTLLAADGVGAPAGHEKAFVLQAALEAEHRGRVGASDNGAQLDDCCFTACRFALRDLDNHLRRGGSSTDERAAHAFLAQQLVEYAALVDLHCDVHIARRSEWFASCTTPSGRHLGVGQPPLDDGEAWRWDSHAPESAGRRRGRGAGISRG